VNPSLDVTQNAAQMPVAYGKPLQDKKGTTYSHFRND
jgi:hypothetical protein